MQNYPVVLQSTQQKLTIMATMEQRTDTNGSVKVNGEALKADRKQAGHTQQSLVVACGSVSLATLRRAEQGHRVRCASLIRIASILGHEVDRYVRADLLNQKTEFAITVEGNWFGLYIEADRGVRPYIVVDETTFHQTGDSVAGGSVNIDPPDHRQEQFEDCRVVHNTVVGLHHIDAWKAPFGIGSFVVKSTRNDDWLEGFSSWYDPDTDRIETSRYILVRKDSSTSERYVAEARKILEQDIFLYELRKLVETGYGVEDAIRMLSASLSGHN